jgi:hypothetical protein
MSTYTYKILLIYPEAEIAGVRAFIEEYIDPGQSENWIDLALSATGTAPATHGWCCFHATIPQANLWLTRFASRLGGAVPEGFTDLPRESQLAWVAGASAALFGASGIYFNAVFEGNPDPEAALTTTGLQRVETPL